MPPTAPEPFLRVSEAARLLGVSPHLLRRWSDRGMIACLRPPDGQRLFRREDLDAFLDAHMARPEQAAS